MTEAVAAAARPKFPHLENLERVLVTTPDFLEREVTVTEKVHGFNVRAGRDPDGTPWYGGRNLSWDADDPKGDRLQGFRDLALEKVLDVVGPGTTVYGEWAGKGIQKGIDYGDEKQFFAFAQRIEQGPVIATSDLLDELWTLGLTVVPILRDGRVTLSELEDRRSGKSLASTKLDQPIEGVVVSPTTPVFDRFGGQVIAKYKSPQFAEVSSARRERVDRATDPNWIAADDFAETYVNANRLTHVLDQVREVVDADRAEAVEVTDPLDVQWTGHVMRTMYEDVLREGKSDYDALSPDVRKLVGKTVNRETRHFLQSARDDAAREAVASLS